MSGEDSTAAFTELKDNNDSSALRINAATTSSLTSSSHTDKSAAAAAHPIASKTVSTKGAGGFTTVTTTAATGSYDWFIFYLSQSRVVVGLLLTIFFVSLCISAWAMGHDTASATSQSLCPAWGDIVQSVVSKCPQQQLQIYYSYDAIIQRGKTYYPEQINARTGPLAVFLPGASSFYYYTLMILDPDYPLVSSPTSKNHVYGLVTNLKLSDSLDIYQTNARWLWDYSVPTASADTRAHRIVFLVYRHTAPFSGIAPITANRFIPETWISEQSWGSALPELIAANYFYLQASKQ